MKKFIFFALINLLLSSCGGGEDPTLTPDPELENRPPSTPTLIEPANNLLCVDNLVSFAWNKASDPDGNSVSYLLEIAKNNAFSPVEHSFLLTTTTKAVSLEKGIAYYWRVKAIDNKNAASEPSSANQFYTEGLGVENHLPFIPSLVRPALNEEVQNTTTLEWSGSDVDKSDVLGYDVYLDTKNPPETIQIENLLETSLEVTLNSSTKYYWKIVAKDGKAGQTIGPIWTFKTN